MLAKFVRDQTFLSASIPLTAIKGIHYCALIGLSLPNVKKKIYKKTFPVLCFRKLNTISIKSSNLKNNYQQQYQNIKLRSNTPS